MHGISQSEALEIEHVFRTSYSGYGLPQILMNFQNTNCSDSRDKVCALRSLAKDEKAPWIGVEYSESLEEIWADLCRTYPEEFLLSGGWGLL